MRHILLFLIFTTLFSCDKSKDPTLTTNDEGCKLTTLDSKLGKIVYTWDKGNLIKSEDFDSSGNLIWKTSYLYNGNKLIKQENYWNGRLDFYYDYEYNDNEVTITSFESPMGEIEETFKYIYKLNTSGRPIIIESYDENKLFRRLSFTYQNGNLTKVEDFDKDNKLVRTVEISYDNKKNIFSNFPALVDIGYEFDKNVNNPLTKKTIEGGSEKIVTYEWKYNSDDFPISGKINDIPSTFTYNCN